MIIQFQTYICGYCQEKWVIQADHSKLYEVEQASMYIDFLDHKKTHQKEVADEYTQRRTA